MSKQMMQILLVEDRAKDVELLRQMLQEQNLGAFELTHVGCVEKALEHIVNGRTDVIILDLDLPDAQGLEVIRQTRAVAPYVPLVVITNSTDLGVAMQALQEGAQDYLSKDGMNGRALLRSIRFAIEHQRLRATIHNPALLDDLTLLLNRQGFISLADHYMRLARFTGNDFVLFYFDVDGFRELNDWLGEQQGDEALKEAADLLKNSFRKSDVIGRIGGDEFAVLMIDAGAEAIEVVRPRLERKLRILNAQPKRRVSLSLSTGILPCRGVQTRPLEELVARAETRMREEKDSKNSYSRL
jgi:two-component system cell cycle response regulator